MLLNIDLLVRRNRSRSKDVEDRLCVRRFNPLCERARSIPGAVDLRRVRRGVEGAGDREQTFGQASQWFSRM